MPSILQPMVERVGGERRAAILAVGVVAAIAIFGLARWATAPTWVPAFTGVPLESVGMITDKLTAAGVEHRLEHGGQTVLVPAASLAEARVTLARDGSLPGVVKRPGFELFDQPSWGQTDLAQRVNYRRALEGQLEQTIGEMRGIEWARVSLVMHEADSYGSADTPTEGSVVLKLESGETPAPAVVRGIANLVASSVQGLSRDRVTIVDDAGHLLTEAEEAEVPGALTSRQLDMQTEVETRLRAKTEQLLGQLVGPGNAKVQVAASLNFDRVERTSSTVDPERQVIATEQRAEITPGAEGDAGSTNSATTYENTRTTENVAAAIGSVRRLTVAVLVADAVADSAARGAVRTAAAPAYRPRTAAELQQIETLVRSAVGYDSSRGDVVTVVSAAFAAPVVTPPPAPTVLDTVREFHRPITGSVLSIVAMVVALLAIRSFSRAGQPGRVTPDQAELPGESGPPAALLSDPRGLEHPEEPVTIVHIPTNPRHAVTAASVEQRPEVALKVVRAWLHE